MILPYYVPYNISDHVKPFVLVQSLYSHPFSAVDVDYGDGNGVVNYPRDFAVINYVYNETGSFTVRLSGYYAGGVDVQVAEVKIYDDFEPYDADTFFDYISATTNNYSLPYSRNQLVQSNDWVVADNINAAINAIYSNFQYLEDLCHRPDIRGDETIIAWLGTSALTWIPYDYSLLGSSNNDFISTYGNQLVQITTTDLEYLSASGFNSIVDLAVKDDAVGNKLYVIDTTSVVLLSSDADATVLLSTNNIQFNKTFNTPVSIDVDSLENIYVADSGNNEVYKFRYLNSQLVLQTSIGGLGTINDKYRINVPNQVRIDSQDRIIISDRDNYAIKIYDELLTWVTTISTVSAQGKVQALTVDKKDDTIYTVTDTKYLQRYTKEGTLIGSTLIASINPNVRHAFIDYSSNYLYVVCVGNAYKFTRDGLFLKELVVPLGDATAANEIVTGRSDEHNQTFIGSRTKIFRIDSTPPIVSIKPYTTDLYYSFDEIKVEPKEGVEDWVYNKSLNRLVHNHLVFARNIFASFIRGVDTANTLQYFVVGTRDYTETLTFDITDDLYVGMNEPVLVNVINRTLNTIYDFQVKALSAISPEIQTVYTSIPSL